MFIIFFLSFSGLSFSMVSAFYFLFLKERIFNVKSISPATRHTPLSTRHPPPAEKSCRLRTGLQICIRLSSLLPYSLITIGSLSTRCLCQHGRQIAGENGSTPAYMTWLVSVKHATSLIYYGYATCCFDSFFPYLSNFLNYYFFFKTMRDMFFQSFDQIMFSVDELTVLLEENNTRNPEFNSDRFELADMNTPECKASFILKNMIYRR